MNGAYLHLLINHVPVVGSAASLLILIFGMLRKSEEIRKLAMLAFIVTALFGALADTTGDMAMPIIRKVPEVLPHAADAHHEAADVSVGLSYGIGIVASGGLFVFRKRSELPRYFLWIVLVGGVALAASMGWTSHLGGMIRHPEIRADYLSTHQVVPHR